VTSVISAVRPGWAVPGGRIAVAGVHLPLPGDGPPHALVGPLDAQVVAASHSLLRLIVPAASEGGTTAVRIDELPGETAYIEIARTLATGVHQVDSPAFDRQGRLYVTHSGGRDTKVAVPIYRVGLDGSREPLAVEIANPTSLVCGPDGAMYVSSRFDGHVYRLTADDRAEIYATELGVPTGLAFGLDGSLYVGDRSGSILRVTPERQVEPFASLPPSVAAFHLAFAPDGCLYVTAPTMSTHDVVYRITPDRLVETAYDGFGRPQGLAVDESGALYVVDALAGGAGLYRLMLGHDHAEPELVLTAPSLVGVAFDPTGGVVLASNDTIWRLEIPLRPWSAFSARKGLQTE
jgi:sugar lactone lactonase YvrE